MESKAKTNIILILSVLFTAIIIAIPFSLSAINRSVTNVPKVDAASINFSGAKISSKSKIYLTGQWARAEGHIVSDNKNDFPVIFSNIPQALSALSRHAESNGCKASYIAQISGLDFDNALIYIPNFAGAYRIFIDGELFAQSGQFHKESTAANLELTAIPFNFEKGGTYSIVIEVTCNMMPDLYMSPVISDYDAAQNYSNYSQAFRSVLFGIVFFLGFFILFYSIKNNNLFSSKWLPVLCFLVAVRMMISTEGYSAFRSLFSSIDYENMTLLICMSTFIIKLVAMLFYSDALGISIGRGTIVTVTLSSLISTALTIIMPFIFFNPYYYIIIQTITLPIDIMVLSNLADSVANKVPYAKSYLFSYIVLIAGIMIDCLYTNGLIQFMSSSFMPLMFMGFILTFLAIFFEKISSVHRAALKAVELDKELTAANTAIMISQIQPHFLYNALNTIKYLIKRDPKTAEKAVISFSKYLRANMDSITQKTPIPFSEELEHIKNYCDIELLRFSDKLNVIYDTDFVDFSVPSLTVQPLVENAIKHGVTKKAEGGTVKLSTSLEDDCYCVIIEDDGVGFDPENPDYTPDDNRSHVGLKNVKNRLKTLMNADMIIESAADKGTKITIKIPKEK